MGDIRVNLTNFVTVALIAFAGITALNVGLRYAGKPNWQIGK